MVLCQEGPETGRDRPPTVKQLRGSADSSRVYRLRTGFGLFAFYALVTLIPIAILGLLLAQSFRSDLEERGLEQGVAVANSVARSAIDPNLSGARLARGPNASERTALLRVIIPLLRSGDALRIRLRDRAGHVIFDPLEPHRGPTGPPDSEVVEAINEKPVRLLTRMNADEVDTKQPLGAKVIEVYTPIRAVGGTGQALGALEIYVPYRPIEASINSSARGATVLVVLGMLALWLTLATISWSVTRRLRRTVETTRRLAREDTLTGLANRTAMADHLRRTLARGSAGASITVATMNIDGFAQINEVLGHANGDKYLCHVAHQLCTAADEHDMVARLGGDEFGLVMPDTDLRQADVVIARVQRELLEETELGGVALTTEITIGLVTGRAGDEAGELLRQSGIACRAAKHAKMPVLAYEPSLEGFDADRLQLVTELRHSLESDALVLHYQPKIQPRSGQVMGVEALLRWNHPDRGLLMPGAFLPAAESTEIIVPLTDRILDDACRQAARWQSSGLELPIAVNISARCLRDSAFADRVLAALLRHHVKPQLIGIEVTETAVISDPVRAAATLRRLAERGMSISIDDFGVGYTSLGHLDQLPIDEIKIDRQFVAPLTTGTDAGAVVRALISLGHELGMTVVAEGVEDNATLNELARLDCDLVQGYVIARPAPVAQFEQWLHERGEGREAQSGADVSPISSRA